MVDQALKRERILAFDLIRGLFLAIIIINHAAIAYGPSVLLILTGASALPASAAEGFFLISGLMVGYVYGSKILTNTKAMFLKMWKRAGLLWFLSVLFTLLYTAWVLSYPDSEKFATLYSRDGISFLYNTFLLRFSFGWTDFLARYAWFMFLAPFALWLIAKRLGLLVATVSLLTWALLRHTPILVPFPAWQIIFVAGIFIGYYFPVIQAKLKSIPAKWQLLLSRSIITLTALTLVLSIISYVLIPYIATLYPSVIDSPLGWLASYVTNLLAGNIDKLHLDPARLVIGSLWFAGIYLVFRYYEKPIDSLTKGSLRVLGQNSLFVYCLHAFILFCIDIYLRPTGGSSNLATGTLVATVCLVAIYYAAKYKQQIFSFILRKK